MERLEEIKKEFNLNEKQIREPKLLTVTPKFFDDIKWLIQTIEQQQGLIESYGRVSEGMTEDYEALQLQLHEAKGKNNALITEKENLLDDIDKYKDLLNKILHHYDDDLLPNEEFVIETEKILQIFQEIR